MATGGEVKMKNPFVKKAPMVAKNPFVPDGGNLGATNGKGTKAFSSGLMATRDVVSSLSIDTLDDDEPHQQSNTLN